jgi:hypothetical protein
VLEAKVQICEISQIYREEFTCEALIVPDNIGTPIGVAAKAKG